MLAIIFTGIIGLVLSLLTGFAFWGFITTTAVAFYEIIICMIVLTISLVAHWYFLKENL